MIVFTIISMFVMESLCGIGWDCPGNDLETVNVQTSPKCRLACVRKGTQVCRGAIWNKATKKCTLKSVMDNCIDADEEDLEAIWTV